MTSIKTSGKIDYENPWLFNRTPFTSEQIDKYVGFVYVIECPDGRRYLGRKYFWSMRKVRGKTRRVKFESNWKSYYGSSEEVKQEIEKKGKENFKRIIISLHTTVGDCNYMEVKLQFQLNVLESDVWINDNINGKWFKKKDHIANGRMINEDYRIF
jgi:hypothetical protein